MAGNWSWGSPRGRRDNVTYVDYYLHRPRAAAALAACYLLIFLLCVSGNGAVCLTALRRRRARSVTDLFILNLAVSDLLVGLFCVPTTLVDNIVTGWPFGNLVCKLSGTVQGISVSASVFTLVAIAADRFRCVLHPFKRKLTVGTSKAIIGVIWALAACFSFPSGVMLRVAREPRVRVVLRRREDSRPFYWCRETWPSAHMRKVYTAALLVGIYLAPLSAIVILYARISRALSRGLPRLPSRRAVSGKKKRVIGMLLLVALLLVLSWLPLWTLMMLSDYAGLSEGQHRVVNIYLYPLAHWLAFFNSAVNPIIYGFFNDNFRRGFRAAFKRQRSFSPGAPPIRPAAAVGRLGSAEAAVSLRRAKCREASRVPAGDRDGVPQAP